MMTLILGMLAPISCLSARRKCLNVRARQKNPRLYFKLRFAQFSRWVRTPSGLSSCAKKSDLWHVRKCCTRRIFFIRRFQAFMKMGHFILILATSHLLPYAIFRHAIFLVSSALVLSKKIEQSALENSQNRAQLPISTGVQTSINECA